MYILEVMGKAEISCINGIINKSNGHFMSLNELQKVYKHYSYIQVYQIIQPRL